MPTTGLVATTNIREAEDQKNITGTTVVVGPDTKRALDVNVIGGSITIEGDVVVDAVTIDNGAGASAVNIQDGGNSITVDGTVELGATSLAALENISVTVTSSAEVEVKNDSGNPIPVSGTVAATQSGTWILGANSGVDIGDVTINNASGAGAVNIQDGGNSITVDGTVSVSGTVAVTQSTSPWVVGDGGSSISIDDNSGSITVDGTVAATQSGTWILGANSGVDIGDVTINNAAGASAVNIQDGGNSITVDGTVAATQSGTWNITNISGTVSLPTGAATLAEQQTQTASLSVMDDWDESDRAKVNIIVGQAGITAGAGAVAANTPRVTHASDDPVTTALQIMDDWDESDRAKVNLIVGTAGVTGNTGTVDAGTQRVTLATNVALPTGTNTIGAVNSGNMAAISTANSRANANLGSGATFTGTYEDITQYAGFTLGILDAGAAGGTLTIDWSEDGATSRDTDTIVIPTANGQQMTWGRKWQYFRVSYTHGAAAGNVVIQTILNKVFVTQSTHFGSDSISTSQDGPVVHALLRGINGTSFLNVLVDSAGNLLTSKRKTTTATHTNVNDTASSTTLLASNTSRQGATIFNDSTSTLYLKLGATASTTSFTAKLYEDDYYEVPFDYTGIIDGIWSSDASGAARIVEFT